MGGSERGFRLSRSAPDFADKRVSLGVNCSRSPGCSGATYRLSRAAQSAAFVGLTFALAACCRSRAVLSTAEPASLRSLTVKGPIYAVPRELGGWTYEEWLRWLHAKAGESIFDDMDIGADRAAPRIDTDTDRR